MLDLQAFTFIPHSLFTGSYSRSQHDIYYFDDWGTENYLKFYGVGYNVMAKILLFRYDLFCAQGLQTHLTSMDTEEQYGKRVRSRMRVY